MKLVATTFSGLEELLAAELETFGASRIKILKRAVEYEGDKEVMYKSNYLSRLAIRVLVPIFHFKAFDERSLYRGVQKVNWSDYMDVDDTLAVDAVTSGDYFTHSKYAALKTKDAIVDQFRRATGRRPNVELRDPKLRIHLRINRDECTLSLDSSNDSLHRRGYRQKTMLAPINEVLAAGLIAISDWDGQSAFIDPMCGSGTILIEAAMKASNTPAQYFRKNFGFQTWKNFDYGIWTKVQKEATETISQELPPIFGYDVSRKAIEVAKKNIREAGFSETIQLEVKSFQELTPPAPNGTIITNPPYDERLETDDIEGLYQSIGDQLKQKWSGYKAWLISSNFKALKKVGLRPSKKRTLFNGALECKFLCYEMYDGSKKAKYQTADGQTNRQTDKQKSGPAFRNKNERESKPFRKPKEKEDKRNWRSGRDDTFSF